MSWFWRHLFTSSNEEILEMIQRGDPSVLTLNQARVLVDMMPDENDVSFYIYSEPCSSCKLL